MGLGPVQHHVANGVAMVDDDIEVRQSAGHRTPGSGLPHGGSPAHDGDTDGSAQRNLRQRIHGLDSVSQCAVSVVAGVIGCHRAGALQVESGCGDQTSQPHQ